MHEEYEIVYQSGRTVRRRGPFASEQLARMLARLVSLDPSSGDVILWENTVHANGSTAHARELSWYRHGREQSWNA